MKRNKRCFDSENSSAEPVAESINTSLGKVSQLKKYQSTGQPHYWLYPCGENYSRHQPRSRSNRGMTILPKTSSSMKNDWLQDYYAAPNKQPSLGRGAPQQGMAFYPSSRATLWRAQWHVLPSVELRSALAPRSWQESITAETAETPGVLSLPELTILDPCLQPKKGTVRVTMHHLPNSPKGKKR